MLLWRVSYQKRALLTKIKNDTKKDWSRSVVTFNESALPMQIKFLTRHPPDTDILSTTFFGDGILEEDSEPEFENIVKNICGDAFNFKLTVDGADWENIFSIIDQKAFYHSVETGSWNSCSGYKDMKDIPTDLQLLAISLEVALSFNMIDGEAKMFINKLLESIQNYAKVSGMLVDHYSPVNNAATNGRIQIVDPKDDGTWENDVAPPDINDLPRGRWTGACASFSDSGDSNYNSSGDSNSKSKPICTPQVHQRVPDHIWFLHNYPGYFVLNVECKSKSGTAVDCYARIQCIHQMLTQMHFQKSAFGLLINSRGWRLFFASKNDHRFTVNQMSRSFISNENMFLVENLKCLCSWLYRILDYRMNCFDG